MSVVHLQLAAAYGDVAEIRRLVATGMDVDGVVANKITALHAAAVRGHVEAVTWPLESTVTEPLLARGAGWKS